MVIKNIALSTIFFVGGLVGFPNDELRKVKPETFEIDTRQSVIKWKGTKMMYTRSHEGTIRFKSGHLSFDEGTITAGQLVVDMHTVEITDIPAHEPVPRKNLKNHLESDFDTRQFPTASLTINKMSTVGSRAGTCGDLTIKGITKEICFDATEVNSKSWSTKLTILRNDFAIGEQGSWLEKRLVDQEIELVVEIHLKSVAVRSVISNQ